MVLVCHVILEDFVIKGPYNFMDGRLVVSHHPSKFGGLRHSGSRYIIILVVEDKVPHAHLTPPLLLTYKVMA